MNAPKVIRRLVDILAATAGIVVLSPLLAALALAIVVSDGRPVLFSQHRVGRAGKLFRIWKFRTMRGGASHKLITAAGDSRITTIGARLRRFKLDELPQLFNVLRGDMSLIGPRPEAPEYVNIASPLWKTVLAVRPGITDLATLIYRDEEKLLAESVNSEKTYRESVLPAKLRLNLMYLDTRSLARDLKLIWLSVRYSVAPAGFDAALIRKTFDTEIHNDEHFYPLSSAVNR
jgi:lipopolysaccharide/colanic/teichoic acid biosynthesis glycosyltransferase